MKKFLTIAITLVVLASLVCMMPVSAATNALTAKANTPTLDGKIDAGEYGEAYFIKDLAGAGWTKGDNKAATPENISYAFAWDAKGLYIAVAGYYADLNPQLNSNPNGVITDATKQGLFFTFGAGGKVTQHNHASKAAEANKPIESSQTVIGDGVMEVFIPVEAFQIAGNENFAMEAGHKLLAIPAGHYSKNNDASLFSYFCAEGWTGTWTVDGINFGTIELLAVPGANTGDFGIIALAFVALSSIAAKKRKDA
ncbi:MAG: hypothetical protein IKJ75_03620 [Clostridia bacterium]|nr:hypothetical protein [Clostridia bacterium]